MEIKQIEEQGVVNLDSLTQSELILYVKQLDRSKTDVTSELRAAEWGLDKKAKVSHYNVTEIINFGSATHLKLSNSVTTPHRYLWFPKE